MSRLDDAQAALRARDWQGAKALFEALDGGDRTNIQARYGYAIAILELGEVEPAESEFDALFSDNPKNTAILFMRGKARLIAGRTAEAVKDLDAVWRVKPDIETLKLLAGADWMRGEKMSFQARLNTAARTPALAHEAAELMRESGEPDAALSLLASSPLGLERSVTEASIHIDMGNAQAAEAAAVSALQIQQGHPRAVGHLITALLMQGRPADALEAIAIMRTAQPLNQRWIADESTALRLMGDKRFNELLDMNKFVRPYELPVPAGFNAIEEFNAALADVLEQYRPYETHPLGQSLRDGLQTSRGLTSIDHPVVEAYLTALKAPIRQYLNYIRNDAGHPLTKRNTGDYKIAGSWSVKLGGGGRHVNHVHSEGWISSSYYVSVPDEVADMERKAGWIKFAEPPHPTIPPSPPLKWMQPKAGVLVLFPSFLWHGTEPIDEGSVRITAPFDIVPA